MATEAQVVEAIRHIQRFHADWRGQLNDDDYRQLSEILRHAGDGNDPGRVPDTLIGALRNQWPELFHGPQLVDPPAAPPPPGPQPAPPGPQPAPPGPQPGPPAAPAPGVPPGEISGQAADAANRLDAALAKNRNALNAADDQLADAILHATSKSNEGRKLLQGLQQSIIDEVKRLGPTLDTPAGQRELAEFLQGKNATILNVVKNAGLESQDQAGIMDGLAARYSALAEPGGQPRGDTPGKQPQNPDTPAGGDPPATNGPGVEAPPPSGAPGGDPMMSGLGADPLMSGLGGLAPAMGALGGLPAALGSIAPLGGAGGGGLPIGDLGSGLGGALRDAADHNHDHDPADPLKDPAKDPKGSSDAAAAKAQGTHEGDPDAPKPAAAPGAADVVPAAGAGQAPGAPSADNSVKLPDGRTRVAASAALASGGRRVLAGASIDEAFPGAGIQMPPLGSPVTAAIPPSRLQFGDVGEYTDHRVMALGDNEVWLNGQVTSLDQLQTGPNFLGWRRVASAAGAAPAPALAGVNGPQH